MNGPSASSFLKHQVSTSESKPSITTPPTISVPKGGGSIKNIGEKFDVNPCAGTATASVPISISKSRGVQPDLNLRYDSGAGNGCFGLGWQLSLPSITRKTSKGVPRYRDGPHGEHSDVFLLSGLEDLVPLFKRDAQENVIFDSAKKPLLDETTIDGYFVRRYAPRIEGSFTRIEMHINLINPADVFWRTICPSNETAIFGNSSNSRVSDPRDPRKIFAWLLCEQFDDRGNAMAVKYKSEDSSNVQIHLPNEHRRTDLSRSANRYIKSVHYGNTVPNRKNTGNTWRAFLPSQLPESSWRFSVVLDYGEHDTSNPTSAEVGPWKCRLDPLSSHTAGFDIRTYRLCERILLFHHFDELGSADTLISSYNISYSHDPKMTRLISVQNVGYLKNDAGVLSAHALPPVNYEYTPFPTDEELRSLPVQTIDDSSLENLPAGLANPSYHWVDLDGEGMPGVLVEQGEGWFYKRNVSSANDESDPPKLQAQLAPLQLVLSKPSSFLSSGHAVLSDTTGTGTVDLVDSSPTTCGFFERAEDGSWMPFRAFESRFNLPLDDPTMNFVDLTGDGLADILICEDRIYRWVENLGPSGYGEPQVATIQPLNEDGSLATVLSNTEDDVRFADMSGDGLIDIVHVKNSEVRYWPGLGYGNFGELITMNNAPLLDRVDHFKKSNVLLADVDGTGAADIIYLAPDGAKIFMNLSGNGFSDVVLLQSFPSQDNLSSVAALDILGSGTSSLVWSTKSPWPGVKPLQYIDLMQGQKPYLLRKIVNNVGGETLLHYTPSTQFFLEDRREGNPWITRLPFPVHCLASVETIDHISSTRHRCRYRYRHGYYDGKEREFRGFGMVEQWDTDYMLSRDSTRQPLYAPSSHTKTWFHTGYFGGENISQQMASEYFAAPKNANEQTRRLLDSLLLDDTVLPEGDLSSLEVRHACRALKGQVLRKEIYAQEFAGTLTTPLAVEESNFTIQLLQHDGGMSQPAIFFVHPREALSITNEKDITDPCIGHSLVLDVSRFGNVLKSLQISYSRLKGKSQLPQPAKNAQETTLFTYTEIDYTGFVDSETDHRNPIPCETRTYELSGLVLPSAKLIWDLSFFMDNEFSIIKTLEDIQPEQAFVPSRRQKRLFNQSQTILRSNDLVRMLPLGVMESLGLPGEQYSLCLTSGLVEQALGPGGGQTTHLLPDFRTVLGSTAGYHELEPGRWWREEGTVRYHPDISTDSSVELELARRNFFTPSIYVDAFKAITKVEYDRYMLTPIAITDPVGNPVRGEIDYRVLSPKMVEDANGNQTLVAFDAHGLVAGTAARGKATQNIGDNLDGFRVDLTEQEIEEFFADPRGPTARKLVQNASTRTIHNASRFFNSKELKLPAYSCTITRITDPLRPNDEPHISVTFSYMDGLYRNVQTKTQAEPDANSSASRWVATGWTAYNERSLPVQQWEPFFDDTHEFTSNNRVGVSSTLMYDALGRQVAILKPDHTFEKIVYPNAWSQADFDANDNVAVSDPRLDPDVGELFKPLDASSFLPSWYDKCMSGQLGLEAQETARATEGHSKTPLLIHFDPLHRQILVQRDLGQGRTVNIGAVFDITGNEISSYDALGRTTHQTTYDFHGAPLRQETMDAGMRWMLYDVTGTPLYSWNGSLIRCREVYDHARRHIETWVQDRTGPNQSEKLIIAKEHGEGAPRARELNLLGKIWKLKDQSGVLINEECDFRENVLSSRRQIVQNYKGTTDWSSNPALESVEYVSKTVYDSAKRPVKFTYPDNTEIVYKYNIAGHIEQLTGNVRSVMGTDETSWQRFVTAVARNAKGNIEEISYGNGSTTTLKYDPQTFRLRQIRTVRSNEESRPTALQDLQYTYDAVGNTTNIQDDAQQTAYFRNDVVRPTSSFQYDALYRLIEASGREHLGQTNGAVNGATAPDWNDSFHSRLANPGDGNAMGNYTEKFEYNEVGAIQKLIHIGARSNGWTRSYKYDSRSQLDQAQSNNRLTSTEIQGKISNYNYDDRGNMTSIPHLRMQWNYKDQLSASSNQIVNNGTPETTYYTYDSSGTRVRKITESMATENSPSRVIRDCVYLGTVEINRKFSAQASDSVVERSTLNIQMGEKRIATVETRTLGTDAGPQQLLRFQLDNHMGSSALELDENSRIISYEEYYPHGSTSYQAVRNQTETPKRYRFCMNERDEESGLGYHKNRYYASWLGVWTSCDPAVLLTPGSYQQKLLQAKGPPPQGESPEEAAKKREKLETRIRALFQHLYMYAANNPVTLTDNSGKDPALDQAVTTFNALYAELLQKVTNGSALHGMHADTVWSALVESVSSNGFVKETAADGTKTLFDHREQFMNTVGSLTNDTKVAGFKDKSTVSAIYETLNRLRSLDPRVAQEAMNRAKPAIDLANNIMETSVAYESAEAELILEIETHAPEFRQALDSANLVRGSGVLTQLEAQGIPAIPSSLANSQAIQWLREATARLPANLGQATQMAKDLRDQAAGGAMGLWALARYYGGVAKVAARSGAARVGTALGEAAASARSAVLGMAGRGSGMLIVVPKGLLTQFATGSFGTARYDY